MLTLGHTLLDAAQVESVREKTRLHIESARRPGFHESRLEARLPRFLAEVARVSPEFQTPAYRDLVRPPGGGGMPASIPFMDKGRLRRLADAHRRAHGTAGFFRAPTSGSTGEPLVMWFDDSYQLSYFARFRFLASAWRVEPEPYSTFKLTVSVFRHARPRRIVQPALDYALYERVNLNPLFWPDPADAVFHIERQSPRILHGMPSSLERLADLAASSGSPRGIRPRLILTMAETLLPGTRRRLEDAFRAPVCDTYGLVEAGGIMAEECREKAGFHINVVDFLVEVVDADGSPMPDGREGEIVVTNLYHTSIPVLRYRTGDFGALDRTPCACGRLEPRIVRLAGRALTRFLLPDGRAYNPFDVFGKYLLALPAAQFRMIQDGALNITLQYRADELLDDHESMRGIRLAAAAVTAAGSRFTVERVARFEQTGKFQAFLKKGDHGPQ